MLKVADTNVDEFQSTENSVFLQDHDEKLQYHSRMKVSILFRSGALCSRLGVVLSMADTTESHLENMAKYVASRFWLLFQRQESALVAVRCHGCVGGTPIALDRFDRTRLKLQCFLWGAPSLVEP